MYIGLCITSGLLIAGVIGLVIALVVLKVKASRAEVHR